MTDIDKFDAQFFGISPREAIRLDPALRLLMETTWEALEDGGLTAERLRGSRTGVYTSCLASGYWDILNDTGQRDLYGALGSGPWQVQAGRISHFLDLRGPSVSVEASCAGSLVATHLACRAIWSGEIDLALIGGANLLLSSELYPVLADAQVLSPRGRCRFGDATADGYVRSEAVLSIVLKPLARAVRDGDRVYAVIIGTSATHVGRSGGAMFSPGQEGQEAALRIACNDAGVAPGSVGYVEAHGTGTTAGDRVELSALRAVLGKGRQRGHACLVGSLKSNFGHSEGAAGLAGLVKTALAIKHRTIPPTLHVDKPNPVLRDQDSEAAPVKLAVSAQPWPEWNTPARAGVSAFGLAGTNSHIVLAEAPVPTARRRSRHPARPTYLLPVSASSTRALAAIARAYADTLDAAKSPADVRDVCFTAGSRRTHHGHRIAVRGASGQEMADSLRSYAAGVSSSSVLTGQQLIVTPPPVVFVFPGQGSYWTGMARDLLASSSVFAARLRECSAAVEAELGWSPARRLASGSPLRRVDEIQPVMWAVQVALAAVWSGWGIRPDLVIGHSMGEIAAATVAGMLSVRDAAAVVCRRGRLLAQLPRTGAMWAVQLGPAAARAAIADHPGVSVGVENSDRSTVLSGDADAVEQVAAALQQQGVFCRRLPVSYASHSAHMDDLDPGLIEALAGLRPARGRVPLHSTTFSRLVAGRELTAPYWLDNLRSPVRFAAAVRAVAAEHENAVFVEISPHPVLCAAIDDLAGHGRALPSLTRGEPATETLFASLGAAYVRGCLPRWERVHEGGTFVPLPTYAWQRRRFWADPAPGVQASPAPAGPVLTSTVPAAPAVVPAPQAEATPSAPAPLVLDSLLTWIADLLELDPSEVHPDLPFNQNGLDSMLAASLRTRLGEQFGLWVPLYDFLENRSPADLVRGWHEKLTKPAEGTRA